MDASPTTLPERVRRDLRDGHVELFGRELASMGVATAITLLLTLPLTGFTVVVAVKVATVDYDQGSQIFFGVLLTVCVGLIVGVLRRWNHHKKLVESQARGDDRHGIYVSPDYVCAWLPDFPHGRLVLIERSRIQHAQLTENHFHSDNVSRTRRLVTLKTVDPERPWVVFETSGFGVNQDVLKDAFVGILGVPWSDDPVRLDDDARDALAVYVN